MSSVRIEDKGLYFTFYSFLFSFLFSYFKLRLETSVLLQTVTQHDNVLQTTHIYHTERYKRF